MSTASAGILEQRLLTAAEVARPLHITRMTVYRLASRGLIPSVHIGKTVRFDPTAIAAFVAGGGLKSQARELNAGESSQRREHVQKLG
jgi:excisionase family DNA binding protein